MCKIALHPPVGDRFSEMLAFIAKLSNTKISLVEIDLMVYKLYELTYDEVKIVEPAFALTKEEYLNYEL